MVGHIIALLWLIAVAPTTQVVGKDAMIASKIIGKGLETEGIRCNAMNTNNRCSLCTPLDIMKRKVSGNDELIMHWTHWHSELLLGMCATSQPLLLSVELPLHIAVAANAIRHDRREIVYRAGKRF